jgi:hypothetical protein
VFLYPGYCTPKIFQKYTCMDLVCLTTSGLMGCLTAMCSCKDEGEGAKQAPPMDFTDVGTLQDHKWG